MLTLGLLPSSPKVLVGVPMLGESSPSVSVLNQDNKAS